MNRNEAVKVGEKVRGSWGKERKEGKEREDERERERDVAEEGCWIDRFKDDHALSAGTHHPLILSLLVFATQFANRLETTPKFQGRVLYPWQKDGGAARLLANSCVKVDPDRHAAFSKASINRDFLSTLS